MKDCLGRIPFGSLAATILSIAGVIIFSITFYKSFQIIVYNIFIELFEININWSEYLRVTVISLGSLSLVLSIINLLFGCFCTGASRDNVFKRKAFVKLGRVLAILLLCIEVFLNILWIFIAIGVSIFLFIYYMVRVICLHEIEHRPTWHIEQYCFSLDRFGVYKNSSNYMTQICDDWQLHELCQNNNDSGLLLIFALCACIIVIISTVIYITILVSSYVRLKTTRELRIYKQAIAIEEDTSF
ncbi:M6b [Intoshia linei]|uniref:M6b n=1 Tax=Intoshia linei TaxID=1819745 RepID=A0A177AWW1_9BILA|nr:M6b [Intoshia linei]